MMRHFIGKLTFVLGCAVCTALPARAQTTNHNFEVMKHLDIFNQLYRELDLFYVDTLSAKKNIGNAINYMLEMIDPYTEYYAAENTNDLKQMTTGKYAGIGSVISYRDELKRCIIEKPYEGNPAADAGLLPGDIILAIDGKDIPTCDSKDLEKRAEYSNSVSTGLRGEPGTTFELKVRRPTNNRTYTFKVTRRSILIPSVALATVLSDSIGYIKITQFIEGTSNEVRRAMVDLKQQGARSLILDLRNNPGGVLEEAVKTVNLFIPRGREVVNMKGKVKEANQMYKTVLDPQDPDIPLIVLTNEQSASSSEITAGALQDYDRALIVGRRTYGKGLVQQSRELAYKGALKLTVGKYYIPSGRCVQAYEFRDGMPVHRPDSLSREFRTANGRIVRDGGGIKPDVEIKSDSLPNLLAYMDASTQLFDFCVNYCAKHPKIAQPEDFSISDDEYADFCEFMKKHKFTYDRQSLRVLETLKTFARFEGYDTEARAEIEALEKKLKHNEDYDFKRWKPEIKKVLEAAIVERYYFDAGRYRYLLRTDKEVQQAVKLMRNTKAMLKTLSGEPEA